MRVNGGNPLQPEQTPLSNSEKTEELPDQNGVHATTPLQMVEEHEEDHLTESERQIMLSLTESERLKVKGYVDDGLNFKDATKLVLLENELRQLDTIITSLEDELTQIESEQRMLDKKKKKEKDLGMLDRERSYFYETVTDEFKEGKAKTLEELSKLRLKRYLVLAQKENAESKSRK